MQPALRTKEAASSAHDRVYRRLRTRIMHGDIAPGTALTLRGIGKQYDVSMTPAREAVRRLVAEGALTLSQSGRVSTPELSNERIEELAALRALIEVELASRALPRAHIALIDRLQAINTKLGEDIQRHDAVGYIRESIVHPSVHLVPGAMYSASGTSFMPATYGTSLSDEELDSLAAYLATLK